MINNTAIVHYQDHFGKDSSIELSAPKRIDSAIIEALGELRQSGNVIAQVVMVTDDTEFTYDYDMDFGWINSVTETGRADEES